MVDARPTSLAYWRGNGTAISPAIDSIVSFGNNQTSANGSANFASRLRFDRPVEQAEAEVAFLGGRRS